MEVVQLEGSLLVLQSYPYEFFLLPCALDLKRPLCMENFES